MYIKNYWDINILDLHSIINLQMSFKTIACKIDYCRKIDH